MNMRHSFIAGPRSPMERGFSFGVAQCCVNRFIYPACFPADMTNPQSLDNPNTPPWMIELEKLVEVARKRREQLARKALKRMFKRPTS